MENQQQHTDIFGLQFDEQAKNSIKTMATWAMIIAVISLADILFSFVEYFKARNKINQFADEYEFRGGFSSVASGTSLVTLVLSTIISLLLSWFLYQFSTRARSGIDGMDTAELNQGLAGLKNYFLTTAVLVIIVMAFMLIAMLFVGSIGSGY
jgi:hypothetical protein